jgi:peptidylprolyl isomerase
MDKTVPAFRESFLSMAAGERRLVWSPAELAALPDEPLPATDLVFDIELLSFEAPMARPANFWAAPSSAIRSASGLAYRVVRPGTGGETPPQNGEVVVRFAGWTPDGEPFDSTFDRGSPLRFSLGGSMPLGWDEGIRSMVVGEERILWIPEDLAIGGGTDWPLSALVFRVELLEILE